MPGAAAKGTRAMHPDGANRTPDVAAVHKPDLKVRLYCVNGQRCSDRRKPDLKVRLYCGNGQRCSDRRKPDLKVRLYCGGRVGPNFGVEPDLQSSASA